MDIQRYDTCCIFQPLLIFFQHKITSPFSFQLQLCDFGLARKLSDISKTPFAQVGFQGSRYLIIFMFFPILNLKR